MYRVWPRLRPEADFCFGDSLSIFFPAFNDAASLPGLIQRTIETVERFVVDYEIIVVNDGSTDDTAHVLACLREQYAPHLRIVTHSRNLGYGAALRSGFLAATKNYIFYTDGDGQYDPGELPLLLQAAMHGAGLVNGYKTARNDPWYRVAVGWLYNHFARWLFRIRLRDVDCDFRLIRRSEFDPRQLRSTGGTICVELVRSLEISGCRTVEVPVSHYPRLHGRSQFFRLRSLASTFVQLCALFFRLVLAPALRDLSNLPRDLRTAQPDLSRRSIIFVALTIVLLSFFAYARTLSLPFIADDYVQIQLGRDYGPLEKWPALARDALYRCRATSLVLTTWIESFAGLNPFYYNLTSLLFHIANSLLVFAVGVWKPLGWRVSALAGCFFAISGRHSEAVIWFSALPELLVFFFILAGLVLWIRWLQSDRPRPMLYAGTFICYLLALLSKESAVALVPLCALTVVFNREHIVRRLLALAPFAALAAGYFGMTWLARDNHLHFKDGTFSLDAPFLKVILRSTFGLLWFWGIAAIGFAIAKVLQLRSGMIRLSVCWIVLSLLPYSFLTYMPRVPSRHTYLASVGVAWLVASALIALRSSRFSSGRPWLVPTVAFIILVQQGGYIWTVLYDRFQLRARPTEMLLEQVRTSPNDVYANCFPYSQTVAEYAIMVAAPDRKVHFTVGPESARHPAARNFCNAVAEGRRY